MKTIFGRLPKFFEQFYSSILGNSIAALKVNSFADNFDADRFNSDGADHSNEFNVDVHAYYFHWFFNNAKRLLEETVLYCRA